MANIYDRSFFESQAKGSLQSARVIVPYILELVKPTSVVDVGCGVGAWLKVFEEHGVTDVRGLDGEYVDTTQLLIDRSKFTPIELRHPFRLDRRFDLAICLEVAEHLPTSCSDVLITSLTALAPVILFSAAIPGQGGAGHINLKYPSFWRDRFAEHGYIRIDAIRRQIWEDRRIEWWYRQNILLYASAEAIVTTQALAAEVNKPDGDMEIVHPSVLYRSMGIQELLARLLNAIRARLVG